MEQVATMTVDESKVVFIDLETTGLDPAQHEIWEVGLIVDGQECEWQLPVNLAKADPGALRVNRYYERNVGRRELADQPSAGAVAAEVARLSAGRHLVGAVPSFDAAFLAPFLRSHGQCHAWHYHLVDVEALIAGKIGMPPPWNSNELSQKVGVDPAQFDRHTALGDARWARALFQVVFA